MMHKLIRSIDDKVNTFHAIHDVSIIPIVYSVLKESVIGLDFKTEEFRVEYTIEDLEFTTGFIGKYKYYGEFIDVLHNIHLKLYANTIPKLFDKLRARLILVKGTYDHVADPELNPLLFSIRFNDRLRAIKIIDHRIDNKTNEYEDWGRSSLW